MKYLYYNKHADILASETPQLFFFWSVEICIALLNKLKTKNYLKNTISHQYTIFFVSVLILELQNSFGKL
jgi:hypothetical protein